MKLLKNRRKLNNKGFTLIELLAVVVILAIVMGISATSVLNSINNSRSSSLYSAAQNAANTLNTWISEDMLATKETDKKLGTTFINNSQSGEWICLGTTSIENISNRNDEATLVSALSLSEDDIVIVKGGTYSEPVAKTETEAAKDPSCSALRYNKSTGGYEILLVAKEGGKYFVSSEPFHYAYSRAQGANQPNL